MCISEAPEHAGSALLLHTLKVSACLCVSAQKHTNKHDRGHSSSSSEPGRKQQTDEKNKIKFYPERVTFVSGNYQAISLYLRCSNV